MEVWKMELARSTSKVIGKIADWICIRLDYYVETKEWEIEQRNLSDLPTEEEVAQVDEIQADLKEELYKQFDTYQGWANYETWNVALWIQNTEEIYNIAKQFDNYKDFVNLGLRMQTLHYKNKSGLHHVKGKTGDNVSFNDKLLNIKELDNMIKELS